MLILSEGSSLTGSLFYSSDIFSQETAARMAGHFKVAPDPGLKLGASAVQPCLRWPYSPVCNLQDLLLFMTQALVQSAVASPETPISRLGIMTPLEHERVLWTFNAVDVLSSDLLHPQQTIHGLLEHWAAATPDVHAVLYEVQHCPGQPDSFVASVTFRATSNGLHCAASSV